MVPTRVQQIARVLVAIVDQGGVGGMEGHPGPRCLPDPTGQAVVIRVDVGDEDTLDIGDVEAGVGQSGHQRVVGIVGVPSGVDDVRPAIGLEGVDQHVAQRVVRDRYRNAPKARAHRFDRREGAGASYVISHASASRLVSGLRRIDGSAGGCAGGHGLIVDRSEHDLEEALTGVEPLAGQAGLAEEQDPDDRVGSPPGPTPCREAASRTPGPDPRRSPTPSAARSPPPGA